MVGELGTPLRRWGTSSDIWPQPGSQHAPDSSVQCLLSQHERYLPLNILAITVADLTAVEEEKQVHHSGWAPQPRGRKGSLRKCRLLRVWASAIREALQKEIMAVLTAAL